MQVRYNILHNHNSLTVQRKYTFSLERNNIITGYIGHLGKLFMAVYVKQNYVSHGKERVIVASVYEKKCDQFKVFKESWVSKIFFEYAIGFCLESETSSRLILLIQNFHSLWFKCAMERLYAIFSPYFLIFGNQPLSLRRFYLSTLLGITKEFT